MKKLTWADKVRIAINTNPELQGRIRVFDSWKSMVKRNPVKYRITHFARSFRFEELDLDNVEYIDDISHCKWNVITETPTPITTIWWYIWQIGWNPVEKPVKKKKLKSK